MSSAGRSIDLEPGQRSTAKTRPSGSAALAVLGVLAAVLLTPFLPTFTSLVAASLLAALACVTVGRGVPWSVQERVLVAAFACVVIVGYLNGAENPRHTVDALGFLIVCSAFWVLGRRSSDRQWIHVTRALIVLVALAAVIGMVESRSGAYVFSGSGLLEAPSRSGLLRARAFFPHPLVLALFCCLALALLGQRVVFRHRFARWLLTVIFVLGIVASGSRTGLAIALLTVFGAPAIRTIRSWRHARVWIILASLGALTLVFGVVAGYLQAQGSLVTSADADAASAQYRAELTRQLFGLVGSDPWGTGFGAVPAGVVLFDSSFGVIDAARTVDSEFALSAIRFGLSGLFFWAVVGWMLVVKLIGRASRDDLPVYVLFLFGGVLALHIWPVVLPVTALFLGRSTRGRG